MSIEPLSHASGIPPATLSPRAPLILVGIDVGGTKTHVLAEDAHGRIHERMTPSHLWRHGDLFDDESNFERLAALVAELGVPSRRTRLAAGLHDCDSDAQMADARRHLARHLPGHVEVVNDAHLLRYLTPATDTIEMIVGTGAIVSGRTAKGERVTVDGHGWPMGDRGSAADLVHSALRSTLEALDRPNRIADPLHSRVLTAFGAADAAELALRARSGASDRTWARHAPTVFAAWDEGSPEAESIVLGAAGTLARHVGYALERGAIGTTVVAAGGVITGQLRYQEAVRTALSQVAPQVDLVVIDTPPVHGALALARRPAHSTDGDQLR